MTATAKPKKSANKWREIERKILANLDILAEYQSFGVETTTDKPNAGGWVSCWAADRPHGNSPSAAINVGDSELRGRYSDRGGNNERLNFWEFAAKYGSHQSWREARKEFAKKTGLSKQLPKSDDEESLEDRLEFIPFWNPVLFRGLIARYPGITAEALQLCGGVICKYPKKSQTPRYCVALPGYGPTLTDGEVRCYTVMACDGGDIGLYQGEGKPPEPRKRINLGPSGMLGQHGLSRLTQSPVIVWKVEGVSDLLALQSAIPPELRNTHLVITNASGTHEVTLPGEMALSFTGLHVALLHDADKPGQQGAKLWLGALSGVAGDVRNVQLPYTISEAHGKDLRDWINEGHSYDDLLKLYEAAAVVTVAPEVKPDNHPTKAIEESTRLATVRANLAKLKITVLGEIASTKTVLAYSQTMRKMVEIRNLDRYKIEHLLIDFGESVLDHVSVGEATETKMDVAAVRRAIAIEASRNRVSERSQIGVGAWLIDDQLYLVNSKEIVSVGAKLERYETPRIGKRIVDFGESSDPWFDFETLSELYAKSESREWCQNVMLRAVLMLGVFKSLVHGDDTELIVSAVCASFLQTVWGFRPQIVISGPTNCGKSWLLSKFVKPMLGDLHLSCDKPSEAGLRQAIGHTAKVAVMDEFERSTQRQMVLDLIRLAARGGTVTKGTANGQKGIQFQMRHMLWMAGIENGLSDAADRNRVILIEMKKATDDGSEFITPPYAEMEQIGLELLAVTLRHWRTADSISRSLASRSSSNHDSRMIESYSVPLAIWGAVHGLNAEDIYKDVVDRLDKRQFILGQEESDEGALLELILGAFVTTPGGARRTVASLLDDDIEPDAKGILEGCGIAKVNHRNDRQGRIFFRQEIIKQSLLKDTKWNHSQINQILLRVPEARYCQKKYANANLKGVSIPVDSILEITRSASMAEIETAATKKEDAEQQAKTTSYDAFGSE